MAAPPEFVDDVFDWLQQTDRSKRGAARERVKALIRAQLLSGDADDAERICQAFESRGYALVRRTVDATDKQTLIGRFFVEASQMDEKGLSRPVRFEIPWSALKKIRRAAIEAANLLGRG